METTAKERALTAFDVFENFINDMGADTDTFTEKMTSCHKTLQQSMYRLCIEFISKMAKKESWQVDPRNEYAVKQCQKIMNCLDGNTSAPFI